MPKRLQGLANPKQGKEAHGNQQQAGNGLTDAMADTAGPEPRTRQNCRLQAGSNAGTDVQAETVSKQRRNGGRQPPTANTRRNATNSE